MQIIDHVELMIMGVTDVEQSKEFYAGKLGFKILNERQLGEQHWISLEMPGGMILNMTNILKNRQPGMFKLGFSTVDAEAALKDLSEKGIKPVKEGDDYGKWKNADGTGEKYFELDDPDGNRVLVYQQSK